MMPATPVSEDRDSYAAPRMIKSDKDVADALKHVVLNDQQKRLLGLLPYDKD
jgi:hypothetical protein